MDKSQKTKLHYTLLIICGVVSFLLTAYGCLASIMLDYWKPAELALILCFVLPFPCFLLCLCSMRLSAVSLWVLFVALWMIRAFTISPNPQYNPVDAFGAAYLCSAVAMQLAVIFDKRRSIFPYS